MIKFSLILPVYNVEKYLEKCLQSCLDQDIPENEYEIIVVIDGSPDKSIDVAKQMQSSHGNIKIIEQSNGGLSAARNTGLANACGEYIWFIDSDDYIPENVLKNLYLFLHKQYLDAAWVRWNNRGNNDSIIKGYNWSIHKAKHGIYNGIVFMKEVLGIYLYAWSFIFKRSFLISNNLIFTEGMFYEDTDFAFRFLPVVERISLYDNICYNYVFRENSIVNTLNSVH